MPIITLITDFGTSDTYVAQMKGVILGIAPEATIVDITHEVPPQNVLAGALALEAAYAAFPPGTIHVGVVDPGVGSARWAIAVETQRYRWVGPDNGLFTLALAREKPRRVVVLDNQRFHRTPVSPTFHGRDIFAPAAAHLARGATLTELGPTLDGKLTPLHLPEPQDSGDALLIHVLTADCFGNLITDLTAARLNDWLAGRPAEQIVITVGPTTIHGLSRTFADVETGKPLAFIGSGGRLEVAVREENVAGALSIGAASAIRLSAFSEVKPPCVSSR